MRVVWHRPTSSGGIRQFDVPRERERDIVLNGGVQALDSKSYLYSFAKRGDLYANNCSLATGAYFRGSSPIPLRITHNVFVSHCACYVQQVAILCNCKDFAVKSDIHVHPRVHEGILSWVDKLRECLKRGTAKFDEPQGVRKDCLAAGCSTQRIINKALAALLRKRAMEMTPTVIGWDLALHTHPPSWSEWRHRTRTPPTVQLNVHKPFFS